MNVREFREWLEQFPDDTEVEVIVADEAPDYCPYGAAVPVGFDGHDRQYDYVDFNDNPLVNNDPNHPGYGRRILTLGMEN